MSTDPVIVGCVSGWRDGREVLEPCIDSMLERGLPVYYLDGAYQTYCHDRELVATPEAELPTPREGLMIDRGPGSWWSEAVKRTALLRCVADHRYAERPEDVIALVLDADERLVGEPGALRSWLAAQPREAEWWHLNLYQDREGLRGGYTLPRLIRLGGSLKYHGHTDTDLRRDGRPIAPRVPSRDQEGDGGNVPLEVARILHARHVRPSWRLRMSGRHARLHKRNACPADSSGVHAFALVAGAWQCGQCKQRIERERGDNFEPAIAAEAS